MKPHSFSRSWEHHTPAEIKAYQDRALQRYVREQLLPFSAFYRDLFAKNNITAADIRGVEDLQKLPFTCKDDLLSTPEQPDKARSFILVPEKQQLMRRPSVLWRGLTRGRKALEASLNREYRPIFMTSTTGRSSDPVPFVYTQHDIDNLGYFGGRLMDLGESQPDDRILNSFPYAPHLAYWITHYAAGQRTLFSLGTGGGKVMGTEGNVRLLGKIKPSILVGMPTFVYHVFQEALEDKIQLENLRLIVLGGEKVAQGTRRKLAELAAELGCPEVKVLATYGFTEAKMAWGECPVTPGTPSSGYHLYPDYGIVEIIDPETGEVQPEGKPGEIVFTPFDSRGSVVFRYRTGDYIDGGLSYEECPHCHRRLPRLAGNISRSSEIKNLQLQKVKGTLVDFNSLERMLDDIEGIGTWQLELRKANDDPLDLDELILHITQNKSVNEKTLIEKVEEQFRQSCEISPNRIAVHDAATLRRKQKVGEVMKEEKIVDNRPSVSTTNQPLETVK